MRLVGLVVLDQDRYHGGRSAGRRAAAAHRRPELGGRQERARRLGRFYLVRRIVPPGPGLNDAGVTRAFADAVAKQFGGLGWAGLFAVALLIYFYAHYGFASITAHMVSMFPPFLAVLLAKGAPPGMVIYGFACFTNLAAGLTHFGTTPGPIFYADGYVTLKTWWKVGAVVSVVNIVIWTTAGFAWWKFIGVW